MKSEFSYYKNRNLLRLGCQCQVPNAAPPCSFCTSLTEKEANIFCSKGLRALQDYIWERQVKNEKRILRKQMKKNKPWIGVDFDGTLSYSKDKTVPNLTPTKLIKNVKDLINLGAYVKIFTARSTKEKKQEVVEFLKKNGLPKLEITNKKDEYMILLIDDRALSVVRNGGIFYHELLFEIREELIKRGLDKLAPFDTIIKSIDSISETLISRILTLIEDINNGHS